MIPRTKNIFTAFCRGHATGAFDIDNGFQSSLRAALVHFQNKKDAILKMNGPKDVVNMLVTLKNGSKCKINAISKVATKDDHTVILDLFDSKLESEVLKSLREAFPEFVIKKDGHLIVVKPMKLENEAKQIKTLHNEYVEVLRAKRRDFLKSVSKIRDEDEKSVASREVERVFKEFSQKSL